MVSAWERVGEQIVRARSRLGYANRTQFSRASGVSKRVLDDLETGRRDNYRASTIERVEAALGWAPGSIIRTSEGRRPVRQHDEQLQLLLDAWPHLSRDTRIVIADLVTHAAAALKRA